MSAHANSAKWFLLPWVVGFLMLTALPLGASLMLSFVRVGDSLSLDQATWVGGEHYRRATSIEADHLSQPDDPWYWSVLGGRPRDARFVQSIYNSLFYTLFAVPLNLVASLAVALLLHRPFRGATIVRALVYLPHVLGGVATIVIWSWLLNPQFGWVNELLRLAYRGLEPLASSLFGVSAVNWPLPDWLYSPSACKPALILMNLWSMGGTMLIFLAALRRVPGSLYEAGALDGAGRWPRFRHITLPQITPAILLNIIVGTIFAMQAFSQPYLLQHRRQEDGLLFYVVYLYETAFEPPYELGYAMASSWMFVILVGAIVWPLLWWSRRWVHYNQQSQGV